MAPTVTLRPYIMPKNLYLLTIITLTLSCVLFVFALLDLATAGYFLNVTGAGITILHDSVIIHLARRAAHRNPNQFDSSQPITQDLTVAPKEYFRPAASFANIAFLGSCIFVLIAGLAMTIWSLVSVADGEISWGTGAGTGTVAVQVGLDAVIALLLSVEAVWCIGMHFGGQRRYGQLEI